MGSTGSKSRLCKVTPYKSQHKEWTQEVGQLKRYEEQKRQRTALPPLKQTTISVRSQSPDAANQRNNESIIHQYPPRRPLGGFLEAQTDLTQMDHRRRRRHLREAREQRRHKVFYSVNVDGVQQPLKLVTRPTQRDIFWDSSSGERLDPSCL